MTPTPLTRRLQSSFEKYHAAPISRKRDKHTLRERAPPPISPLVKCFEVGVVFHGEYRRNEANPTPYRFYPTRHSAYEEYLEKQKKALSAKVQRDMETVDSLLPIDILIRRLHEQAKQRERPPDPIPIRLKASPQVRRLRIKRDRPQGRTKLKRPERGQFVRIKKESLTGNGWFVRNCLTMPIPKATVVGPKVVAKLLLENLLGEDIWSPNICEIIAHRRACLYREEGIRWHHIFFPGASPDSLKVPAVFRMFDNTDDGIPEKIRMEKDVHPHLTTYQFRVLAKRLVIGGNQDFVERCLLAEILGIEEAQVLSFFLAIYYKQELMESSEKHFRHFVDTTYQTVMKLSHTDEKGIGDLIHSYQNEMIPCLDDLFS